MNDLKIHTKTCMIFRNVMREKNMLPKQRDIFSMKLKMKQYYITFFRGAKVPNKTILNLKTEA